MIRGDRPALLRALPNGRYRPEGGEEIFERMVGAIIVDIGSPADGDDIEGGGLIIDYKKDGTAGRLVLAFNDLGAWVESDEFPATPASYQGQCHQ